MAVKTNDPATATRTLARVPENRENIIAALTGSSPDGASFGDVSLDDVDGLTPDMPKSTSLSEQVNAVVKVVYAGLVPNQFVGEREGAPEEAAEFIWQDEEDSRYYRAVSSSALALRNHATFTRLLTGGFKSVRARVIGVPVRGMSNDAYGFGAVERDNS